jgi:hypothetical protein
MVNPLLDALLGLSIGGLRHNQATEKANPVLDARQRILAERSGAQAVPAVQPEVASLVPPDVAQAVNTTDVAPTIRPTETITAQEQAVQDNSMQPEQVSDAYKSPPDLSQMYLDMMNKTMRAQQFDKGATLIAAGLAQDQNKGNLIDMASQQGSATGQSGMFSTIYELQTKAAEAAQKQALRARLPSIAKAHGLSIEDVEVMFEGGQLEEFLKEAANPETQVVERSDGSRVLIDSNTGQVIREVGGAKTRKKTYQKIGNKDVLVYEDTGEPVDPNAALPTEVKTPPKLKFEEEPSTGRKLAYDENTGQRLPDQDLAGKADLDFQKLADGTIQTIDKRTGKPVGDPFGPRTDISTEDMKEYAVARAAAEARGEKFPDFDQWLAQTEKTRGPKSLGTEKLTDKLGSNRADQLNTSYEQGKGSRETIDYVNTAREQLEKGIIAGSEFSPLELRGRKLWADILGFGDDDQAISNTETFRASLKEVVLSKIKALGSGTAISDADRRYIDQATGGDITLNEASMRRIFDILDKGARKRIDQYNSEVDELLATFTDPGERAEVERNLPKIRQPEAYKSTTKTREEGGTRRTKEDLMKQYLRPKPGG